MNGGERGAARGARLVRRGAGLTRRDAVLGVVALALAPAAARAVPEARLAAEFAQIERRVGGRLGVTVLRDGRFGGGHRPDERFPMCSTFKLLLAAHVLARVDREAESLARAVRYTSADLVTYSPVTERHVAKGSMSVAALCDATVTTSDNTAANLLLAASGGPRGLTEYVRTLGDSVTRLDRVEPDLNEATPGDPRDTTSPRAFAHSVHALVLGDALSPASRARLTGWLRDNRTGDERLRAGLAPGWTAGEKTGSCQRGSTNDAGVLWAPDGTPWIVAAYLTECGAPPAARNAALADVARAITGA